MLCVGAARANKKPADAAGSGQTPTAIVAVGVISLDGG